MNKKKLLMLALIPLLLSVMGTPAMAKRIGPSEKAAEKNPNMEIVPGGLDLYLPSGGAHSWMANTEDMPIDIMHIKDASKAIIPNAYTLDMNVLMAIMANPEVALEYENMWGYMSYDTLLALSIMEDPAEIVYASDIIPNATAGQPNVTVVDASGFSIGDEILISGFNYNLLKMVQEVNVVESVDTVNNVLTMESDLQYTYNMGTVFKPSEKILEELSLWPEGVYVMFVNVGKYWYS